MRNKNIDAHSYCRIFRWWHVRDKAWFTWKACLHKDTAWYISRLETRRPKGNVPRVFPAILLARGNALFFFIGPTRGRQRRKCFGRKCTRVKALAFSLYDLTRIYEPLPGIAFPILCYISVGNPSRFSSPAIRSVETHPMLQFSFSI